MNNTKLLEYPMISDLKGLAINGLYGKAIFIVVNKKVF